MKIFEVTRISTKLLVVFIGIIGITFVGLFALLETRGYLSERRDIATALQRLIKTQSVPIAAALWELDNRRITSFLEEVVRLPFIQGIIVKDTTGSIVARSGNTETPPKHSDLVAQAMLVSPRRQNSETIGSIKIIAHDREILRSVMHRIKNNAIVFMVLMVVLTGATFFATNAVVGKPLALLLASIEKIRSKGVREQVDWDATDELGKVISAYNEMQSVQEVTEEELRHARDNLELRVKERTNELSAARDRAETTLASLKKTQQQLVQSEKMASLGQLTAGIAHEIKNPLNFVNNFAETSIDLIEELKEEIRSVRDKFENEARENVDELLKTVIEDLGKINDHGRRADGIVKSMLLHARGGSSDRLETALNPLVSEALKLAFHGERAKDKSFQVTIKEQLDDTIDFVEVVPNEVTRVMVNLLGNAFYAVKMRAQESRGTGYEPSVLVTTLDRGGAVEIRVRDNGTGIPKDIQEKLFEPFFTTKPPGEGTGLGLSMCFDIIVQQHGGQMSVDSKPGKFTEFIIALPRHAGDGLEQEQQSDGETT